MHHNLPDRGPEQRLARAYETASVCCLLPLLALLLNAGAASGCLSRISGLGSGAVNFGLCLVAALWLLSAIFCARRSLLLRLGSAHFEKRREFEAEVDWMEKFLGLRDPDEEPAPIVERHLWRPHLEDLDAPYAPPPNGPWRI